MRTRWWRGVFIALGFSAVLLVVSGILHLQSV
jgi:hypothetical protein